MHTEIAPTLSYRLLRIALYGFTVIVLIYLILPQFIVIPLSFSDQSYLAFPPSGWSLKWYARMAQNPSWSEAAMNSL
ncbi:MAG: ABC transporter permease, partial [Rhizobiaceae bacterium]